MRLSPPVIHKGGDMRDHLSTHKAKVVSTFTNKGGVGKTTTTYNVAAILANYGLKVLVVDADSQCNLSAGFLQAVIAQKKELADHKDTSDYDKIVRRVVQHVLRGDFSERSSLALEASQEEKDFHQLVEQVYESLIECPLKIEGKTNESSNVSSSGAYFSLSKSSGTWKLELQPAEMESDLERQEIHLYDHPRNQQIKNQIPGLLDFLKSLGEDARPEDLIEENIGKIRELLRKYSLPNFLSACTPWAGGDARKDEIDRLAMRLCLHELKSPVLVEDGAEEARGSLLLLPGSYKFSLEMAEHFSAGIRAIREKEMYPDRNPVSLGTIYGVNELIRRVAEIHGADIVICDLGPGADHQNAVLFSISNAILSVVNPEAYSDDAMKNVMDIVIKWNKDFKYLYKITNTLNTGCNPIEHPPIFLGYGLQKVPLSAKGMGMEGEVTKEIAAEIQRIFDHEVVPLIRGFGMYPSFGLLGFDDTGKPLESRRVPMIQRFREDEKGAQRSGLPIVWRQPPDPTFLAAFERMTDSTVVHWIIHDEAFRPEVRERLKAGSIAQKKIFQEFSQAGAERVFNYYNGLSLRDRFHMLSSMYYRLDLVDMALLIGQLKNACNKSWLPYAKNTTGVLILDPCLPDQLAGILDTYLESIKGEWQADLKCLLVPVVIDIHWICVRVEIHDVVEGGKTISFLLDDPRGCFYRTSKKTEESSVVKKLAKRSKESQSVAILPESSDVVTVFIAITETVKGKLASYFGTVQFNNRRWTFNNEGELLYKVLDQQGGLGNDTDSGIIVINNMYVYMLPYEGRLRRNGEFDKGAKLCKLVQLAGKLQLQLVDVKRSPNLPTLYDETIGEFKSHANKKNSCRTISSQQVIARRQHFSREMLEQLATIEDQFSHIVSLHQARNHFVMVSYGAYVEKNLGRIIDTFRPSCEAMIQQHHGNLYFPSEFLSVVRSIAFKSRSTDFEPREGFAQAALTTALIAYGDRSFCTHRSAKKKGSTIEPVTPIKRSTSTRPFVMADDIQTIQGVHVRKNYWYEDYEMSRILTRRLAIVDNQSSKGTRVQVSAALHNLSSSYSFNDYLASLNRQPGIALIPFNVGLSHWVGLLLEYNENHVLIRAEYFDSSAGQAPAYLNDMLAAFAQKNDVTEFVVRGDTVRQTNGHDCGPCTIENLLAAIGYPEAAGVSPVQRRFNHLDLLRQDEDNIQFYRKFYARQCQNQSSFDQFAQRSRFFPKEKPLQLHTMSGSLSIHESYELRKLAIDIKEMAEKYGNDVIMSLNPVSTGEDEHAAQLAQIRTALKVLWDRSNAEDEACVSDIIYTFFVMDVKIGFDSAKLQIDYNQIAVLNTLCGLDIEQLRRERDALLRKVDKAPIPIEALPMEVIESSDHHDTEDEYQPVGDDFEAQSSVESASEDSDHQAKKRKDSRSDPVAKASKSGMFGQSTGKKQVAMSVFDFMSSDDEERAFSHASTL